jgi:hypothetical protein
VLLGNGDGTFATAPDLLAYNPALYAAGDLSATWDFNGDGLSDIASVGDNDDVTVYLAGSGPQSATASLSGISVVGTGSHLVDAAYSGDNEYQPSLSYAIGVPAQPVPTALTLTASPATSLYGQPVVLTASVAPNTAQNHAATGTVTFSSGGAVVGTGTVANGVASTTVSNLSVGTDTVTAGYSGDVNFSPSSGTATEAVTATATATTLTAAPNPALLGQTATLTATVSAAGAGSTATPAGTIAFYDGSTPLGTAALTGSTQVVASASATLTTSALALGTHALTAVFANNGPYYGSTGAASLTITTAPTSTLLSASADPAGLGQAVTFTATVSGTGAPSPPSGSVTFYDGSATLGTVALSASGTAAYTTSTLALGTHSIAAAYTANGPYAGSASAVLPETVLAPDFRIALASPSITLPAYDHTTTTLTLASAYGFAGQVALACANLPQYVTCIPTPSSTALAGSTTVSLYLDTDSRIGAGSARDRPSAPAALSVLLTPFAVAAARRRTKRKGRPAGLFARLALLAMPVLLSLGLGSCAREVSLVPAAAPGTYIIPITAKGTTSNLAHTANLTLTIAPAQ